MKLKKIRKYITSIEFDTYEEGNTIEDLIKWLETEKEKGATDFEIWTDSDEMGALEEGRIELYKVSFETPEQAKERIEKENIRKERDGAIDKYRRKKEYEKLKKEFEGE